MVVKTSNVETKLEENAKKNTQLIDIIQKMGSGAVELSEIIQSLNEIYTEDFRHYYSTISRKLRQMDPDEREMVSKCMQEVIDKLIVYERENELKNKNINRYDNLINSIVKLNDHINLEIERMKLEIISNANLQKSISETQSIESSYENMREYIDSMESKMYNMEDRLNSYNTQALTILSIFAGLVFAFTGGFSFISTALQNIHEASVYKLTFTLMIVGLFIYDLIFLFFYMIAKITNKNISAHCTKTGSCECGWSDDCEKCKWYKKIWRKFWFVLLPNVFFVLSMIGAVIIWCYRVGGFN